MRYGVLGPLVVLDGDHLTPLGGSTQRRILAALLPDVGTPVAWETLAARVWDEVPVRHTLPRLHRGLDQLRDRLGDDALRVDDHSVVLTATRDDVDAGAFERQALQARELLDAGAFVEAREQLLAAQQLWRGSPYVEFTGAAFAAVEAARLGQLHADVEDGLVAAGIALGQGTELVELARRTTQRAPADARGWARLAVVLYRAQQLPAAVHACEEGLRACDDPQQLLALRDRLEHHDPVLMAPDPWSGTGGSGIPQRVAILLLDLVGSTRMWATHADHMPGIMAAFHGICDRVVSGYGGRLPPDQGEGDARLGVFPTVDQAVAAAAELTRRLAAQSWPDQLVVHARMSVHVGDVVESGGNVFGQTVNYTARVRGLGHGGQVLLSDAAAAELTRTADTSAQVLGSYPLRDIEGEQQVWQLRAPGLGTDFPPLKVEAAARALVRLDPDAPCPYRGLAAYDVDDAALFAGRERLTAALAARLVDHDLVIVTGPSGAGKSSLVRAGLLAALRQGALPGSDAWQVAVTVPATDPVAAVSVADADLLVLDQAEELFTLSDEDARREAAAQLAAQLERGCRVVLVIRGDFFGRLAELPELAPHVGSATVLVGAPNDDDLRRVVEEPAARVGLLAGEGLVDAVLDDVRGNPAALPLLSTALVRTWQHRDGATLTLQAYRDGGGVAGAVEQLAEETYGHLSGPEQVAARRVLVRLARDEDGVWARRPVPTVEVAPPGDTDAAAALQVLVANRLVTVDRESVQLTHEALLTAWPRLTAWLEERRDSLYTLAQLAAATHDWDQTGRLPSDLARGPRLQAVNELATAYPEELTPLEQEFVQASLADSERELAEATARAEREARGARRLRVLAAVLAVAVVASSLAAWFAVRAQRDAARKALTADAQRLTVLARTVDDPALARRLALAANSLQDSTATRGDLLATLEQRDGQLFTEDVGEPVADVAVGVEDEVEVVAASGATIGATKDASHLAKVGLPDGTAGVATTSTGLGVIVQRDAHPDLGCDCPVGGVWVSDLRFTGSDLSTWRRLTAAVASAEVPPAWSGDRVLVVGRDGRSVLSLDSAPGSTKLATWRSPDPVTALSASSSAVVALTGPEAARRVSVLDPRTLALRSSFALPVELGTASTVAASPDGRSIAVAFDSGDVVLAPLATASRLRGTDALTGPGAAVTRLAFSPDSRTLASGSDDGLVLLRRASDGLALRSYATVSPVRGLAWRPDGLALYAGTQDGTVRGLDTDLSHALSHALTGGLPLGSSSPDTDGKRLVSVGTTSRTRAALLASAPADPFGGPPVGAGVSQVLGVTDLASGTTRTVPLPGSTVDGWAQVLLLPDGGRALTVVVDPVQAAFRTKQTSDLLLQVWDLDALKAVSTLRVRSLDTRGGAASAVLSRDGSELVLVERRDSTPVLRRFHVHPLASAGDLPLDSSYEFPHNTWWPTGWEGRQTLVAGCGDTCLARVDTRSGRVRLDTEVETVGDSINAFGLLGPFEAPAVRVRRAHGDAHLDLELSDAAESVTYHARGQTGALGDPVQLGTANAPAGFEGPAEGLLWLTGDGPALTVSTAGVVSYLPSGLAGLRALACAASGGLTRAQWSSYLPRREFDASCA